MPALQQAYAGTRREQIERGDGKPRPSAGKNILEERFASDASAKGANGVPHPALRRGLLLFSKQAVTLHVLTLPHR